MVKRKDPLLDSSKCSNVEELKKNLAKVVEIELLGAVSALGKTRSRFDSDLTVSQTTFEPHNSHICIHVRERSRFFTFDRIIITP